MNAAKPNTYGWNVTLSSKHYFEAELVGKDGTVVWSLDAAQATTLKEQEALSYPSNPAEVEIFLKEQGIIKEHDSVLSIAAAKNEWEENGYVQITIESFDGFYESTNDEMINRAVASLFEDDDGNINIPESFHAQHIRTKGLLIDYAKEFIDLYKEVLSRKLDIELPSLRFLSLGSPSGHRNTEDVLYAEVKLSEIKKALENEAGNFHVAQKIKEAVLSKFESGPGFHSSYKRISDNTKRSNFVFDWITRDDSSDELKPIEEWDENELGVVLYGATECISSSDLILCSAYPFSERVNSVVWNNLSLKEKEIANNYRNSDENQMTH